MTKTHVLLRNRRTVDNEVKHKRTCYKRETIPKAKRDRSESPSDYNEPPKLELMPVVEDADENFDYPHALPNEDNLRPGKTILSCPVESCNIRRFHVIEIISHFRQDHSNDYNSYEPTIQVYNCPLCSTKRFNSATTSSTYSLLQEHVVRYHGRSLNENEFPLFCSIKINSIQNCSSLFNNNDDNHISLQKKKKNNQNLNDVSIKSDPDAIENESVNTSFEKEENASTHSAALTLASLQQLIDEKGTRNATSVKAVYRSHPRLTETIKSASSLDALSKVAHFNTVINSPSMQREMNNNIKSNGISINSIGKDPTTDLANINGLHTLAILSMQNQEILDGQKSEEMTNLGSNGQRQILPKLSTNPVKQSNKPIEDILPNKRSKDNAATNTAPNNNGPSRKRPLPPLAMKPLANSLQSSATAQVINNTVNITSSSPMTPANLSISSSSIANNNNKISNGNNKLAKMALPPLSMATSLHPKLILPANMNGQSVTASSIQTSSAVQTLGSKIIFSNATTAQGKACNQKAPANQKLRQQNLQDSINTNNNLTALMLQIQSTPGNNNNNAANTRPLATSATISSNFRNCPKVPPMTAIITSTNSTPAINDDSTGGMAKNSPIRLMINTSDVCSITTPTSATSCNNSLGNPSPTRQATNGDQLKKISPNSFIKRLAIVQNSSQSTSTVKQPTQQSTNHQPPSSAQQKQSLKQPSTLLKILPKPPKISNVQNIQKKDAFIKIDEDKSLVLQDKCNKHKPNNHNLKNITAI